MTDIAEVNTTSPDESAGGRRRKGSGLDSMVLPELKQLASSLGLRGTGAMRKGQLIDAIRSAQNGSGSGSSNGNNASAGRSSSGGQSVLVDERPQDASQRTAPVVEASTSTESSAPAETPQRSSAPVTDTPDNGQRSESDAREDGNG